MKELEQSVADARAAIAATRSIAELEQAKARFLGKSGAVTELLKGLGRLSAQERPQAGAPIKEAKLQGETFRGCAGRHRHRGSPQPTPPRGAVRHHPPRARPRPAR